VTTPLPSKGNALNNATKRAEQEAKQKDEQEAKQKATQKAGWDALYTLDYGKLKKCIQQGFDVNSYDDYGDTPLIFIMKTLLPNAVGKVFKPSRSQRAKEFFNPFSGRVDIITLLLDNNADANKMSKKDKYGEYSPLITLITITSPLLDPTNPSIFKFTLKVIKLLADNKAKMNLLANTPASRDIKTTPLLAAIEYRHNMAVLKSLIERGALVNKADGKGDTPLKVAKEIYGESAPVVKLLEKEFEAQAKAGVQNNAPAVAQKKAAVHKNLVAAAQNKVAAAQNNVAAVQNNIAAVQNNIAAVQNNVAAATKSGGSKKTRKTKKARK
jgi:ankyrin repeat protein